MIYLNIKALSVNQQWKGQRYKTDLYKLYEKTVLNVLPKMDIEEKPLKLILVFGFSSKLQDIDSGLKAFLDILVKKYGVDDRFIFELSVKKEIVKKGFEFIKFKFEYMK